MAAELTEKNRSRQVHAYQDANRGDRAHPRRTHSRYWVLVLLHQKLRSIAESEWLVPGDSLIDFGCGNKPYEQLFSPKFRRYVGADFPGNALAQVTIGP